MSKEVMRLALEALEAGEYYIDDLEAIVYAADDLGTHEDRAKMQAAITVLRLEIDALNMASKTVKPDFWEGYVPEPVKPATEESSATQAQQALDKKAENARELGLDYEPAQHEPEYWNVISPAGSIVASETDAIRGWARIAGSYKPTVESLLGFHDQGWRVLPKVAPPAQRTWVSLTDEELSEVYNQADWDTVNGWEYERAIEAKLKEKNNG